MSQRSKLSNPAPTLVDNSKLITNNLLFYICLKISISARDVENALL